MAVFAKSKKEIGKNKMFNTDPNDMEKAFLRLVMRKIHDDYDYIPSEVFVMAVGNIFVASCIESGLKKEHFLHAIDKCWDHHTRGNHGNNEKIRATEKD